MEPKQIPLYMFLAALFSGMAAFSGCGVSRSNLAVIMDGVLVAPRWIPPVKNDFDFELNAIDGLPIKREVVLFPFDSYAGAETSPGFHVIKVLVYPIARPPNCEPKAVEFNATVEAGRCYAIVGSEKAPALVEYH